MEISLKASATELGTKIASLVEIELSPETISKTIEAFYLKGMDEMEKKFNMNFIPESGRLESLNNSVAEAITKLTDDVKAKVKRIIIDGVINYKSLAIMSKDIYEVIDDAKFRAEMIARTETNRAYNMSHVDSVRQSGLKVQKFVSVILDHRTSPICKHMNSAYGNEDKSIQMNSKFKYQGESWDIPPFHPNCRTRVLFVQS